ncbi:PRC-barrel domain-containing protein [Candidatus Micrarchaeota archaeon]|nr:PRC-barrel domain-containing protein [Candidatus Micrarchaeota archaeon]
MGKYIIARQLSSKKVITNEGDEFGRLVDLNVSETTGKVETLVIEPNPDSILAEKLRKDDGMVLVPYESVLAISDYVLLDKRNITY